MLSVCSLSCSLVEEGGLAFSVPSWVYYIVNNLFFFGLRAKSLSIWKVIFGLYNSQDFNCLLVCTGIHLFVFFCSMTCYLFCSMIHSNDVHNFCLFESPHKWTHTHTPHTNTLPVDGSSQLIAAIFGNNFSPSCYYHRKYCDGVVHFKWLTWLWWLSLFDRRALALRS